jgi:phosphoribosylamine---glycine ligase
VRALVVGGGGREHALCWALHRDFPEAVLFAAPGNPGTVSCATNLPVSATAVDDLVDAVSEHRIDLTIIGPEAPLALGLGDRLRRTGHAVFGPSQAAARLESSKAFAKTLMHAAGVPTAASETFTALDPALRYLERHPQPVVVKASGLAAGKGVVVCTTRAEAARAAAAMLDGSYGPAGREIVIEEFLEGEELSVLALVDRERFVLLPPAQDHKRLLEGDRGPNTGGMGAYCPVSLATESLLARIRRDVFEPTLREMAARGAPYQGVLYAGLMIHPSGTPFVLEFNCRFGDPETEALLPALAAGVTRELAAIAIGGWRVPASPGVIQASVTTVLAAAGYPEHPETGAVITTPHDLGHDVLLFHAGTARADDGMLRVAGGRVFAVTGLAPTVAEAAARSASACARIEYAGKQYRRDVGWREIARAGTP